MRLPRTIDMATPMLFALPVIASAAGAGSAAKMAFPAAAAALALWLAHRDPARYLQLLLWTLTLAPGLRHFNDWYIGFSQSNPIMLAPYLVVVATTPRVALYLLSARRYSIEFIVLVGLITVGLLVSMATGAMEAGLMAAMRWMSPPWVAIYVCARADRLPELRQAVHRTMRLLLPLVALYGLVQFADIAPWDAYFMKEAPIASIGFPVPFAVRVFGTMNSPGSLAAMLCTGMLLLLPTTRGWRWTGILLASATLLLTTQRAALGAFLLAVLILLVMGRDRAARQRIGKLAVMVSILCAVMLAIPGAATKVMSTADSLSALSQDDSAQERLKQYREVPLTLDGNKLGRGLGWSVNTIYISVGDQLPLDSGIIDILVSLGLPAGFLFLAMLIVLAAQGVRIVLRSPDGTTAAEFSAAMFGLAQLPFGSQHAAEHGIFLFLALGLLLGRSVPVLGITRSRSIPGRLAVARWAGPAGSMKARLGEGTAPSQSSAPAGAVSRAR